MLNPALAHPTVRALSSLYASTFLSGTWAMVIPTIPILAIQFGVSAGGAAQAVTAFDIGKFIGTVVAEIVLDRLRRAHRAGERAIGRVRRSAGRLRVC